MSNSDTLTGSTLGSIFSLFVSTDGRRKNLLKPFTVDDQTYATDGHVMIYCDNKFIDFEFENKEKPPLVRKVIPDINSNEVIDLKSVNWESLKTWDETKPSGEEVECGNCDGEGTIEDYVYYKRRHYNVEYDCPVCDGSGFEEEQKQIKTGGKTFDPFAMVKVRDTFFYVHRFYLLKVVQELIDGREVEMIAYKSNEAGMLFKIGFLYILMMPVLSDDDSKVIHKFL